MIEASADAILLSISVLTLLHEGSCLYPGGQQAVAFLLDVLSEAVVLSALLLELIVSLNALIQLLQDWDIIRYVRLSSLLLQLNCSLVRDLLLLV